MGLYGGHIRLNCLSRADLICAVKGIFELENGGGLFGTSHQSVLLAFVYKDGYSQGVQQQGLQSCLGLRRYESINGVVYPIGVPQSDHPQVSTPPRVTFPVSASPV